ncbi:MAG: transcription elongation factor GreA [Patescibacteria group bacterium]
MAKAAKSVVPQVQVEEEALVVTKEGLKALEEELNNLKTVRRREIAQRLKEAIGYGDLSENSEYEEAKNEQALMEGRIIELEEQLKKAKVVDEKQHSKKIVEIGTKVKIRNVKKKTEELEFTLVGSTESDVLNGRISNESPFGQALMGAKVGEKVSVEAPSGVVEYEVLKLA